MLFRAAFGVVTLIYLSKCLELERIYSVVAIYAIFCVSNALEHVLLVKRPMSPGDGSMAIPPSPDLSPLQVSIDKVLDCQNTQIKALDYVIGFIRSYQERPPQT